MVKSPKKKKSEKKPKDQPIAKRWSKVSKSSAGASSTPVKVTKKRPLSTKPVAKKKSLLRDDSVSSEDLPTFKKSTSKKQKLTETFKKYGVIVPSLEEILEEQKQFQEYKEQVKRAIELKNPNFTVLTTPSSVRKSIRTNRLQLDCKHLTLEEITQHFNINVSRLRNIINGKFPSQRHKQYHLKNVMSSNKSINLKCSSSSMAFTFDQLDHMATLMNNHFDSENISITYLFQVLIPELCSKIFMDVHHMTKHQAQCFFDNCPVN